MAAPVLENLNVVIAPLRHNSSVFQVRNTLGTHRHANPDPLDRHARRHPQLGVPNFLRNRPLGPISELNTSLFQCPQTSARIALSRMLWTMEIVSASNGLRTANSSGFATNSP